MSDDLKTLVITIILTMIIEHIVLKFIPKVVRDVLIKSTLTLYTSPRVRKYVTNYYIKNQHYDDLYMCKIQNYSMQIPFLSKNKWYNQQLDIYHTKSIIEYHSSEPLSYRLKNWRIKKRIFIGQKLFNDKALYLSEIINEHRFIMMECDYYQKLTLVDSLESETFHAAIFHLKCSSLRNKLVKSFETAIKRKPYPISIGCDVAFVINISGKRSIAMQNRSAETASYGGCKALVPSFGFTPIPNDGEGVVKYDHLYKNIFLYNIIKEYCEELHNRTDLERRIASRSNPYWFYEDIGEAKELIEAFKDKKATCTYLGFGVDAINGMANMAAMIYIEDEALSVKIKNSCVANWETKGAKIGMGIEFIDIDSPCLVDALKKSEYQAESAFTLSLALERLNT